MNYNLAKKLENAGFSQTGLSGKFPSNGNRPEDQVYAPTLEELIDACGDDFLDLLQTLDNGWYARSAKENKPDIEVKAKTPIEAVANLWLKLHNE